MNGMEQRNAPQPALFVPWRFSPGSRASANPRVWTKVEDVPKSFQTDLVQLSCVMSSNLFSSAKWDRTDELALEHSARAARSSAGLPRKSSDHCSRPNLSNRGPICSWVWFHPWGACGETFLEKARTISIHATLLFCFRLAGLLQSHQHGVPERASQKIWERLAFSMGDPPHPTVSRQLKCDCVPLFLQLVHQLQETLNLIHRVQRWA